MNLAGSGLNLFQACFFFSGFNETYDNLSYKTLSIMYWVHHRVSDGRFKPKWIFKVDDDNLVDIYKLELYLKSIEKSTNINDTEITYNNPKKMFCSVRDDATPIRYIQLPKFTQYV